MDIEMLYPISGFIPLILILGGIFGLLSLAKFFRNSASASLKVISLFGFLTGILLLISGVVTVLWQTWSIDVWVLLGLTGLGLTIKYLRKIPFSALLGLATGLTCVGLLYLYFPLPATVFGISSIWLYLAVFLVPALIVFVVFKFFEELTKFLGMILGSWPVLTILGLLCIIQGIMLLLNTNLLNFLT